MGIYRVRFFVVPKEWNKTEHAILNFGMLLEAFIPTIKVNYTRDILAEQETTKDQSGKDASEGPCFGADASFHHSIFRSC